MYQKNPMNVIDITILATKFSGLGSLNVKSKQPKLHKSVTSTKYFSNGKLNDEWSYIQQHESYGPIQMYYLKKTYCTIKWASTKLQRDSKQTRIEEGWDSIIIQERQPHC